MGVLEIVLLIIGVILGVASFVIPAAKEPTPYQTKSMAKEEIKNLVDKQMEDIRLHVDDVVDEAVGYAVEKTERALERLSNEKIMAVNEYSDTVLEEIHKNHEEAMFLYDMLNAKHDNLKNTVSEANKAVQEVQETVASISSITAAAAATEPEAVAEKKDEEEKSKSRTKKTAEKVSPIVKEEDKVTVKEWDFLVDTKETVGNKNEQILALAKQGKSTVAIARELGLGVGEVKLVIDLYKNM